MRHWTVSGCLVAVLLASGCERKPSTPPAGGAATPSAGNAVTTTQPFVPTQEVVAKVNQATISTTDVTLGVQELKRLMELMQQRWQPLPAQDLPDALDLYDVMNNLVDAEVKATEARRLGLDRQREVQERFAYLQRNFYAQEWDRWQRERGASSDEAVHQFYEQHQTGFMEPERIRARQLVTETLADAEAARAKAVQSEPFDQLARTLSVGAGKEQGGDIGWHLRAVDHERLRLIGKATTESVFFPQLESVAFALEVGQVSQPVKGPDGRYYLVQLQERVAARQQTEIEVHDAIKELLTMQNLAQQVEQLRAKAQIQRFPEHLEGVKQ